jgi:hypothetical protein
MIAPLGARLTIKVICFPRSAMLRFTGGECLYAYGREPDIARQAKAITLEAAEALAKDVARALAAAWGK